MINTKSNPIKNIVVAASLFLLSHLQLSAASIVIAKQKIAKGEFNDALLELQQLDVPQARYYEGWCHMQLGDCPSANVDFNQFIATYNGFGLNEWKAEALANMEQCGFDIEKVSDPEVSDPMTDEPEIEIFTPETPIVEANPQIKIYTAEPTKIKSQEQIKIYTPIANKTENDLGPIKIYTPEINVPEKAITTIKIYTPEKQQAQPQEEIKIYIPNNNQIVANKEIKIWTKQNDASPSHRPYTKEMAAYEKRIKEIRDNLKYSQKETPPKKIEINEGEKISKNIKHYRILFSVSREANKSFLNVSALGPVTSEGSKSGYYSYYVGFYPKKEAAEKALKKVISQGYKAAEIIEF